MGAKDVAAAAEKRMRLRYAGCCRLCGRELAAGAEAIYERSMKTVRCISCLVEGTGVVAAADQGETEVGMAGGSARRRYEQLKIRREERIRAAHPRLGGLILAASDDPQSMRAWVTGAEGEEKLGTCLSELVSPTFRVLHDRRIPGSRANIDHLVVCPSGVWVIDAKKYQGRPQLKVEGGIFRPRVERLIVGRRDCTKLVDGMLKQAGLVHQALATDDVPVHGVLCFVDADWPLIGGAFATRGVQILWPKRLAALLAQNGPVAGARVLAVHTALARQFPTA